MKYEYDYPRAAIATDLIIINLNKILLIRRKNEPFKDMWALPGGFFDPENDKSILECAKRELAEETGVRLITLSPSDMIGIYDEPDRDPRHRTVSLAYYCDITFYNDDDLVIKAGDDAALVKWVNFDELWELNLAFDHKRILRDILKIKIAKREY